MPQQLVADRLLHARSGTAFAVTPTLREAYAEGDDDELAEVAVREAALASLRLLAGDGPSGSRRRCGAAAGADRLRRRYRRLRGQRRCRACGTTGDRGRRRRRPG